MVKDKQCLPYHKCQSEKVPYHKCQLVIEKLDCGTDCLDLIPSPSTYNDLTPVYSSAKQRPCALAMTASSAEARVWWGLPHVAEASAGTLTEGGGIAPCVPPSSKMLGYAPTHGGGGVPAGRMVAPNLQALSEFLAR